MSDELSKYWDQLEEMGVSEQTLQIVTSINGYNLETLEDVLYAHAGYRSFSQLNDEDDETDDEDDDDGDDAA